MQGLVARPWIIAGVVLASAGMITITPVTAPSANAVRDFDIQLTGSAEDIEDITLDLVRHGQSTDDLNNILGTLPPGAPLTPLGETQAETVAQAIQAEFPNGIAGVYASELIRTQESADWLAQALGMDVQVLSTLNEIPAGILEGQPRDLPTEVGFFFPFVMWVLGDLFVSEPGTNYNGAVFDEQVTNAVDTIYTNTVDGHGPLTDVAYSSGGLIAIWTLMNASNPPIVQMVTQLLDTLGPPPNAGETVLEGNPTDGWTVVSFEGEPVPATPDLLTGLFVDYRDLVIPPQLALWNIIEAMQGGDQADITSALQTGFDQTVAALEQFPQSVIDTLTGAMGASAGMAGDSVVNGLLGSI